MKPRVLSIKQKLGKMHSDSKTVWTQSYYFIHDNDGKSCYNGQLTPCEDGAFRYLPFETTTVYSAKELRLIADNLDKLNKKK